MARLRLHIQTVPHTLPRPVEDEIEGERLAAWVREAVGRRKAPPAAVVLRPERSEIIGLGPVNQARVPLPRFMGGLCRSTVDDGGLPYAVAVIGLVHARRRPVEPKQTPPPPIPMAVVFLEWPDNRWWYWKALLDADGAGIREGTEVVARAVDGDPMPSVFGRWWALSRRVNLSLHLTRDAPVSTPASSEIVH